MTKHSEHQEGTNGKASMTGTGGKEPVHTGSVMLDSPDQGMEDLNKIFQPKVGYLSTQRTLRHLAQELDQDGDGNIDENELKEVLRALAKDRVSKLERVLVHCYASVGSASIRSHYRSTYSLLLTLLLGQSEGSLLCCRCRSHVVLTSTVVGLSAQKTKRKYRALFLGAISLTLLLVATLLGCTFAIVELTKEVHKHLACHTKSCSERQWCLCFWVQADLSPSDKARKSVPVSLNG